MYFPKANKADQSKLLASTCHDEEVLSLTCNEARSINELPAIGEFANTVFKAGGSSNNHPGDDTQKASLASWRTAPV